MQNQTARFALGREQFPFLPTKQQDHGMSLFGRWLVYHDD